MELTVLERLVVLEVLPREGDYTTLKILRELREALSFSEAEHALLQFTSRPDGRLVWKVDAPVPPKAIALGERAHALVVAGLTEMERQKKLPLAAVDLYERFIPPTNGAGPEGP